MTDTKHPEALRLADRIKSSGQFTNLGELDAAAAELRRLHAENVRLAALVEAQQPATHVQNPAGIEHVAGDVSKNGPESNMTRAQVDAIVYACRQAGDDSTYAVVNAALQAQQPAPSLDDGDKYPHALVARYARLLEREHRRTTP